MTISNIRIFKIGHLYSQESQECNCMFDIGEMLKIDIVMAVTTQTVKKGIQTRPSVYFLPGLVWNLYFKPQVHGFISQPPSPYNKHLPIKTGI